jgi:hypothetical protein
MVIVLDKATKGLSIDIRQCKIKKKFLVGVLYKKPRLVLVIVLDKATKGLSIDIRQCKKKKKSFWWGSG